MKPALLALAAVLGGCTASNPCDARREEAAELIGAAVSKDLSCQSDADCHRVSLGSHCTSSCSVIANSAGAEAVQVAIDEANANICGEGCAFQSPCPSPPFSSCVDGQCSNVQPQDWTYLVFTEGTPVQSAPPPKCGSVQACTQWSLTPDKTIVVTKDGVAQSGTMTSADFEVVDGILRSVGFRRSLGSWQCDPAATDQHVSMNLGNAQAQTGFDATNCVRGGPAGNDVQRLYETATRY